MAFDWEKVLGTTGGGLPDAYDEQASDSLYQDHARLVPAESAVDLGDERVNLPFMEA